MKPKYKTFKLITISLFLIIGNYFIIFAQSGLEMSVSGLVRDVNSNMPIPGVEINIFKLEKDSISDIFIGTSDKNGFFKIRYLKSGNYIFRIKLPGIGTLGATVFEKENFNKFEVQDGRNLYLNIFLGENYIPTFEKNVSLSGGIINIKILYDNNFRPKVENLQRIDKLKLSDNVLYHTKSDDLIILGPYVYEVPDEYILKDSKGKESSAVLVFQILNMTKLNVRRLAINAFVYLKI
jgi:hypothetical protein